MRTSHSFIKCIHVLYSLQLAIPGAHNDNEEEMGEGRSVSRPRKRLKFQNILTVVALLSLDLDDTNQRMHNVLALCTTINSERFYDTDQRPRSSSK